jgi:hypothetical protein
VSSPTPTPWAVTCPVHAQVFLTRDEFDEQYNWPRTKRWRCTRMVEGVACLAHCEFDEEHHDGYLAQLISSAAKEGGQ